MRLAFPATCLLALALAGCAGVSGSTEEATSRAASAEPLVLTKAEAKATAKGMVLRDSDVPGWTRKPDTPGKPSKGGDVAGLCRGLDALDRVRILGEATSPAFEKEWGATVRSEADILPAEKAAHRTFAAAVRAFTAEKGRRCFLARLKQGLAGEGLSLGKTRVRPLGFRVGARSWGFRLTFRFGRDGILLPGHHSIVLLHEGQAVGSLVFTSVGKPLPRTLERRLARVVAERMKLAQEAWRTEA